MLAEYLIVVVSIRDVVCTIIAKGEIDDIFDRWSLSKESLNVWW